MSAPARPMGPRRAPLPTPNRAHHHTSATHAPEPAPPPGPLLDPPAEMISALGPPPSALSPPTNPRPPSFPPGSFLTSNSAQGPSATPLGTPMHTPGSGLFQAPPPPPPLPGRASASPTPPPPEEEPDAVPGVLTPSEMMRSSRMGLYANANSNRPQLSLRGSGPTLGLAQTPPALNRSQSTTVTPPLKPRPKPRVEVPSAMIPSELDSADADDERIIRSSRPRITQTSSTYERSNLAGGGGVAAVRPKLGLRTASALPDDDAPAPNPQVSIDPGASLTSLRPKLQLPGAGSGVGGRPKLGLSLPGSQENVGPKANAPSLKLDLSAARGGDSEDDDDYSYYGKPTVRRQTSLGLGVGSESFPSDSSAATLRPPSTTTAVPGGTGTVHHSGPGRSGDGLDEVRRAINELRMPSLQTYDESTEAEADETGAEDNAHKHHKAEGSSGADGEGEGEHREWTDDMLEPLKRLGEGAGGAVNTVRDKRTGKIMARKTIPTGTVPARQLLRELQFSQLHHPNLVLSYGGYISSNKDKDAGNDETSNGSGAYTPEIHILMEFCEGGALDAIARQMKARHANVRIGEKVIARLAEGVLKGLDYLHENKVIHRDIKPSNIVVTKAGIVKLCDFGVSGVLEASLANTFTGTSWYMAPERITGHPYSIRADVWSTGLTFLELAQNRFPYPPDLGPIELLTYIVNGEVPELDDEPGDENGNGAITWSDGMKSFIKLCLRIDGNTRPPPRDMLKHPWIQESIARKLDMAKWIREVWGWEKPVRAKRSSQQSQEPT